MVINNGGLMVIKWDLPSGYVNIAIENDHRKFVDFPMKNGWIFP